MSLSRNDSIVRKGSYCPVVKLEFKTSRIEQSQCVCVGGGLVTSGVEI